MQSIHQNYTNNQGWLTNKKTKKKFRRGVDDLVSQRIYEQLPARFRRDSFNDWCDRQRIARQKLARNKKAWKLLRHYRFQVYFYTLSIKELDGEPWLEDAANYDDPAAVEAWLRLLDKAFPNMPYQFALHVGRCGRVHAHVLAGQNHSIPKLSRNPERRKRVTNHATHFRRVVAYLTSKAHSTPEQVSVYRKAVKAAGGEKRLPQHSGFRGCQYLFCKKTGEKAVLDLLCKKDTHVIANRRKENMTSLEAKSQVPVLLDDLRILQNRLRISQSSPEDAQRLTDLLTHRKNYLTRLQDIATEEIQL